MFIVTRQAQQQFYFELARKQLWDYIAKSSAVPGFYAFALNPNNSRKCLGSCAADRLSFSSLKTTWKRARLQLWPKSYEQMVECLPQLFLNLVCSLRTLFWHVSPSSFKTLLA